MESQHCTAAAAQPLLSIQPRSANRELGLRKALRLVTPPQSGPMAATSIQRTKEPTHRRLSGPGGGKNHGHVRNSRMNARFLKKLLAEANRVERILPWRQSDRQSLA
jgi:hypothetical protein